VPSDDSEIAVDRFHPCTARAMFGTAVGWLYLAVMLLAGVLVASGYSLAGLLLLLVGAVIVFAVWLHNITTTYTITSQRLIIHQGVFVRSVDDIELYRVKDLFTQFSLLNQITNIGTIRVLSSDPTTGDCAFFMRHVFKPQERRETLRNLVDRQRTGRGVREVDVARLL
jgi:uncharacterized membrane protein YdbT with pleckstrin-like domain